MEACKARPVAEWATAVVQQLHVLVEASKMLKVVLVGDVVVVEE